MRFFLLKNTISIIHKSIYKYHIINVHYVFFTDNTLMIEGLCKIENIMQFQ
jgi:hypothetical protein